MPAHRTRVERICRLCKSHFITWPGEIKKGGGIYCSTNCYHKSKAKPLEVRFWEKVNKTDGCWIWTGATMRFGYGLLGSTERGKSGKAAHRVSWELHYGPIPDGLFVLHHCDNPACVRPDHLFLGTLKDNTQDMLRKRRHKVKLTDEQVADLRARYAGGLVSQTELAKEFGLGQSTVSRIVLHKNTY